MNRVSPKISSIWAAMVLVSALGCGSEPEDGAGSGADNSAGGTPMGVAGDITGASLGSGGTGTPSDPAGGTGASQAGGGVTAGGVRTGGAPGAGDQYQGGGSIAMGGGEAPGSGGQVSTGDGGGQSGGLSGSGGNPDPGGVSSGGASGSGGTTSSGGAPSGGAGGPGGTTSSGGGPSGGAGGSSGSTTGPGGAPWGGSSVSGGPSGGDGGLVGESGGAPGEEGTGGTGAVTNDTGGEGGGGETSDGGTAGDGSGGTGGSTPTDWYPCDGSTEGYDAVMVQSGSTWVVTAGGAERYSGSDTTQALNAAYDSLSSGRTSKESILVQGDGDIPASSQVGMPSYTILNWCGTLHVSGTPSGSDRSPLYARGKTDIDIPNLKMTGSPQYGLFFRGTNNIHLGQIELNLTSSAGIGIRVDTSGSAGTDTNFVRGLIIDYVRGSGMGSQLVETYGVDDITIGTVEGADVGECGLLLNRSINAEVDLVTCENCATGTGYAAFRVANRVGLIDNEYPPDNIHVKKVVARGGGRGIFSVSGCGGLTIDEIDIANTGNTSILLQNTYNTTIAAVGGTVVGGLVQVTNDTDSTTSGEYPPTENVAIMNLTLSGGASVRQDWCSEYGANGCTATNITGGNVSMCQ